MTQNGNAHDASEACRKLLLESKVKSLWRPQAVVILKDNATVDAALKVLADNRILSAPVVVAPKHDETPGVQWPSDAAASDILGFVDVNGVLMSLVNDIADQPDVHGNSMLKRMRQLEVLGAAFANQHLSQLLPTQGFDGDFLHSKHAGNATVLELVMYGFLDPKRRGVHEGEAQTHVVHRVAMFDSAGHISHVISQTDIVRYLARHRGQLGPLEHMTLAELGWDRKPVVCCAPEMPALDAMKLMTDKRVSSLAIVGSDGHLMGNFSASELRTILAEHFGALALPVGEFLAQEHATEYVAANRHRLVEAGVVGTTGHEFVANRMARSRPRTPGEEVGQTLVLARSSNTFADVMEMLLKHRIHRVYVVDEDEAPVGIVTCTDIMRKVVEVATCAAGPGAGALLQSLPKGDGLKRASSSAPDSAGGPAHRHHHHQQQDGQAAEAECGGQVSLKEGAGPSEAAAEV